MAGDYPDWSKPRTLDALPNSDLFEGGDDVFTQGNVEGNRDLAAVPAGNRYIITTWVALDHDGTRRFQFRIVRGGITRIIAGGLTPAAEQPTSWSGYLVLEAGDIIRTRTYAGTGANRISWSVMGWIVPV